ncbi:MAG: hypothetical protein LKE48_02560 [Solobacterium sp.]|jgi:cystathionine beta-lyase family protein involved in aluminum resistance|nr:hypothetical protein [Solobacterium sp.]
MIKFETMGEDTVCCTVTGSLHDLQQEVIGMYTQLKNDPVLSQLFSHAIELEKENKIEVIAVQSESETKKEEVS